MTIAAAIIGLFIAAQLAAVWWSIHRSRPQRARPTRGPGHVHAFIGAPDDPAFDDAGAPAKPDRREVRFFAAETVVGPGLGKGLVDELRAIARRRALTEEMGPLVAVLNDLARQLQEWDTLLGHPAEFIEAATVRRALTAAGEVLDLEAPA